MAGAHFQLLHGLPAPVCLDVGVPEFIRQCLLWLQRASHADLTTARALESFRLLQFKQQIPTSHGQVNKRTLFQICKIIQNGPNFKYTPWVMYRVMQLEPAPKFKQDYQMTSFLHMICGSLSKAAFPVPLNKRSLVLLVSSGKKALVCCSPVGRKE